MFPRSITALRASRAVMTPASSRGMAFTSTSRLGLKESSDSDNIDYSKHKSDSLEKQKQGKGHWKPELASDSEEAVKADRSGRGPEETAKLQERTKRAAEESAQAGTSVKDNM
ncbi:uncharacterized protein F5Z01DRAFT_483316 [Emericellopsis atlantica]|uniref:Mitochondrial carrier protein pet8 n=1 Tax=Emericellopsis atlantica TaxID=2614577 RepID=A0A9P7ZRX5_9HYPO|nr:uncharacterized protein F5Z01DRAFT_483316 [Emericellopsis atlantica]KAG9256701.1 hypothetical protein F5Z01DRAFT_483316 [Emericellopsis atlantica]